ncbi:Receptor-like cytosolic serine/threonine-protein kinase RBK1 [Linum perenne]
MSMDQEIEVMEGHATQMQREFVVEESSPRCVLEAPSLEEAGADLDHCAATISADSETLSDKQSTIDTADVTDTSIQWKSMFGNIKKKSVRRFSVIPLMSTYETITRINVVKKKLTKTNNNHGDVGAIDNFDVFPFDKPSWKNFRYKELAAATDDFNSGNMIGKGGYAEVYKGHLPDGRVVAVKKIMKTEKKEENMMTADFLSELGIIAHINHPNAAKLLGFSIDSGLHLVLEYLPFGSLGDKLHGSGECLDWEKRYKAATGIAEGLKYLHHDCPRRVIHRDIKASNILLAEDYEAQVKYLAPEYFMDGIVDEKTDVFAYGVLLLEIVTGRHAVEHSTNQSLAMWAKPLLEQSDESALIDPRLGNDFNLAEMKRAMVTAFLCIDHDSDMRPSMARVVQILNGEDLALDAVMVHKTSSGRGVMLDASDLQDYTCTNYLNDLNRHMQLVME